MLKAFQVSTTHRITFVVANDLLRFTMKWDVERHDSYLIWTLTSASSHKIWEATATRKENNLIKKLLQWKDVPKASVKTAHFGIML